jgi:hypothetical protein
LQYWESIRTQVKQFAHFKVAPDAQVVVEIDLADGHPFKVRSHGVHFSGVDADAAEFKKRCFGVVHA